jgi:hypothetical protein
MDIVTQPLKTRPSSYTCDAYSLTIMNTFVNRFASTSAANELRNGDFAAEDGEFSDAMWGSEAGFGSLAKGVPNFTVPAVSDVSIRIYIHMHLHVKQVVGTSPSLLHS